MVGGIRLRGRSEGEIALVATFLFRRLPAAPSPTSPVPATTLIRSFLVLVLLLPAPPPHSPPPHSRRRNQFLTVSPASSRRRTFCLHDHHFHDHHRSRSHISVHPYGPISRPTAHDAFYAPYHPPPALHGCMLHKTRLSRSISNATVVHS